MIKTRAVVVPASVISRYVSEGVPKWFVMQYGQRENFFYFLRRRPTTLNLYWHPIFKNAESKLYVFDLAYECIPLVILKELLGEVPYCDDGGGTHDNIRPIQCELLHQTAHHSFPGT
jgi:hypothetical protein